MIETRMKKTKNRSTECGFDGGDCLCAVSSNQKDYRGTISKTESGVSCEDWDSEYIADYPDAGLASNYCRNPNGDERAWCFTNFSSLTFEYCNVPSC